MSNGNNQGQGPAPQGQPEPHPEQKYINVLDSDVVNLGFESAIRMLVRKAVIERIDYDITFESPDKVHSYKISVKREKNTIVKPSAGEVNRLGKLD